MIETVVNAGKAIEAQDIIRNMVLSHGNRVFRVAKVIPMHLVGIVITDGDNVTVQPTYTHVQLVTTRGGVLNLSIFDKVTPVLAASL